MITPEPDALPSSVNVAILTVELRRLPISCLCVGSSADTLIEKHNKIVARMYFIQLFS